MEKVFYLSKETRGREENGCVAHYSLSTNKPFEMKEGWEVEELIVNTTGELNEIIIEDQYDYAIHGIVKINTDVDNLQKTINIVRSIDGYNSDILFEIIWSIFEGEMIEVPENKVYF